MIELDQIIRSKGLKIFYLNIRSLKNKITELSYLIIKQDIDILAVTETWLHKNIDTHLVDIEGYILIRLDRTTGKRGGGLEVRPTAWIYYKKGCKIS